MISAETGDRLKVFISYARVNSNRAVAFCSNLAEQGFDAFLDIKDILPGEPWRERLAELIALADAVVFLISPQAIASEICDWEVQEAERLCKRIQPVVIDHVDNLSVPRRLSRLNFIFMRTPDEEKSRFAELVAGLHTDIFWVREHTRLTNLARSWQLGGQRSHSLLRGDAILDAERWAAIRPDSTAEIAPLVLRFLDESRINNDLEYSRVRRTAGVGFIAPVLAANQRNDHEAALRYAVVGAVKAQDPDFKLVPELYESAFRSISSSRGELSFEVTNKDNNALRVEFCRNENALAVFGYGIAPCLIRVADGCLIWTAPVPQCDNALLGTLVHKSNFSDAESCFAALCEVDGSHDYYVWNYKTNSLVCKFQAFENDLYGPVFSPTGGLIATIENEHSVAVREVRTGNTINTCMLPHHDLASVTFSPCGRYLLLCGGAGSELRDPDMKDFPQLHASRTAKEYDETYEHQPGFSTLWDFASGLPPVALSDHVARVHCGAFSPNGSQIAIAAADRSLRVFMLDGTPCYSISLPLPGQLINFSRQGHLMLTTCQDRTVRVFQVADGMSISTLKEHLDLVSDAQFSPDGTHVASVCSWHSSIPPDTNIRIWDLGGQLVDLLAGHERGLHSCAWAPDGALLATGGMDKCVKVWRPHISNSDTGTTLSQGWRVHGVMPDRKTLIAVHEDGSVTGLAFETGDPKFAFRLNDAEITAIAASKDGKFLLLTSDDGFVSLIDVETCERAFVCPIEGAKTECAALDPSLRYVALGQRDSVVLWSINPPLQICAFECETEPECLHFSKSGSLLVEVACNKIKLRRMPDGEVVSYSEMEFSTLPTLVARQLAFNNAETLLAVGNSSGMFDVFEVPSLKRVCSLRGCGDILFDMCFSSNDRMLLSGAGKSSRLWDTIDWNTIGEFRSSPGSEFVFWVAFGAEDSSVYVGYGNTTVRYDVGFASNLLGQRKFGCILEKLEVGLGQLTAAELADPLMEGVGSDVLDFVIEKYPEFTDFIRQRQEKVGLSSK